jgi:hypothetical protein
MANASTSLEKRFLFQGSPRRLTCYDNALPDTGRCEIVLPQNLRPFAEADTVELWGEGCLGADRRLRLCLAAATPPGVYAAELRVAGKSSPAVLDIEPSRQVRMSPSSLNFEGPSGGAAEARCLVVNRGNVTVTIPKSVATGIYDNDGIETALADTYRQNTDDVQVLLGHLFRGLREGHGGLLKLHIGAGAGDIPPGTERTLLFRTKLPEKLKPGHSYHGIWKFDPMFYRINVKVQK